MDEKERDRIEARAMKEADTHNRLTNLEKKMEWGTKAVWGAIIWLGLQVIEYLKTGWPK